MQLLDTAQANPGLQSNRDGVSVTSAHLRGDLGWDGIASPEEDVRRSSNERRQSEGSDGKKSIYIVQTKFKLIKV